MFILDPKTATKERDEKNMLSYLHFFVATNITKLKLILFLNCWRNLQRILGLFTQNCHYIGLGSAVRKNLFRIPDLGSKRHRMPDPDPQYWLWRQIRSDHLRKFFLIVGSGPDNFLFRESVGPATVYAVLYLDAVKLVLEYYQYCDLRYLVLAVFI